MELPISLKVPAECSGKELDAFENLVKFCREVNPNGLRNRIEWAHFLAWASTYEGELVGVAALKRPNEGYRSSVFEKSQSKEEPGQYEAELGWICIKEEFRRKGLATKLVAKLFSGENPKSVYATAREKNDPILPILKNLGFVQSGGRYPSTEGDYGLVLYIKPV